MLYHFADIMGVVEGFEEISKITTMFGERDIVKFRITDGRYEYLYSSYSLHFFCSALCVPLNTIHVKT